MKPRMSETQFADAIVDLAHIYGWTVSGFRAARTKDGGWVTPVRYDGEGWPDITLVHPELGIIFAELKVRTSVTKPQQDWLNLLDQAILRCGRYGMIEAVVWRPDDSDRIIERLSNGTTTRWNL